MLYWYVLIVKIFSDFMNKNVQSQCNCKSPDITYSSRRIVVGFWNFAWTPKIWGPPQAVAPLPFQPYKKAKICFTILIKIELCVDKLSFAMLFVTKLRASKMCVAKLSVAKWCVAKQGVAKLSVAKLFVSKLILTNLCVAYLSVNC